MITQSFAFWSHSDNLSQSFRSQLGIKLRVSVLLGKALLDEARLAVVSTAKNALESQDGAREGI